MIRKYIAATAIATTALLAGATAAGASSTTTIAPAAKATVSYSPGSWGDITGGRLYDTNAGDAKCARLYAQGYNIILGGGGWKLLATVCAGGSTPIPAEHYSGYSDHVDVKVCAGTATSGTACKTKRLW